MTFDLPPLDQIADAARRLAQLGGFNPSDMTAFCVEQHEYATVLTAKLPTVWIEASVYPIGPSIRLTFWDVNTIREVVTYSSWAKYAGRSENCDVGAALYRPDDVCTGPQEFDEEVACAAP